LRRPLALAAGLVALSATSAAAQLIVNDPLIMVQTKIIAATRNEVYDLQVEHASVARRMARGIATFLDKSLWIADGFPLWRTRYTDPPLAAGSLVWFNAINGGDATGIGYRAVTNILRHPDQAMTVIGFAGAEWLRRELATIDLADSTGIAGAHQTGMIRGLRKTELDALLQLEEHVRNPNLSTGAVAEVLAGAQLLRTRQNEREIGITRSIAEQLLVDSKRERDAQVTLLNMRIASTADTEEGQQRLGSADEIWHFSLR
jgi:hypothetical protein